jgi:hemoglobin-like flavoprotein
MTEDATFDGASAITESLEIAAQRGGDLTSAIYARLFTRFPETEALFVLDRNGAVRGAMLSHAFETIFDFIGERRYAHRFISAEIVTHEGYGVAPDAFAAFFAVVADEIEAACGSAWTPAMNAAWAALLSELDRYMAAPHTA